MNRYFMTVDIDGEFRQLEIPQHVVEIIKAEEREQAARRIDAIEFIPHTTHYMPPEYADGFIDGIKAAYVACGGM